MPVFKVVTYCLFIHAVELKQAGAARGAAGRRVGTLRSARHPLQSDPTPAPVDAAAGSPCYVSPNP